MSRPTLVFSCLAVLLCGTFCGRVIAQDNGTEPAATSPEEPKPAAPTVVVVDPSLKSARATMTRFLKQTNASDYAAAAECLSTPPDTAAEVQQELAWKLKYVLDRLALIDLEGIDDSAAAGAYFFEGDGRIVIQQEADGAWRFTPSTVNWLETLFEEVQDLPPLAGSDWLRDLFPTGMTGPWILLPQYQWVCLLIVILVGVLVDFLVRTVLSSLTVKWLKVVHVEVDPALERSLWKPIGLLSMALTWYGGTVLIGLPPGMLSVLLVAVRFFAVVAAIWTAFRLIDLLSSYLMSKAAGTETKFDDLLIPLVSRSLKVFAVCIGLLVFAEAFNLPLAGLLSGLGLGGVAFAFASKDTLGNLFGSLTVLTDRPFEIGDWIKTDGVEGSVETVGIRSTRVRTFYNSLVTLPNSLLTTAIVDNMGRRRYRRIKTMLGLQYDTPPDRMEAFCEGVRELIRRHKYTRKDYFHVYFNQFSASSLDVMLYCFLECPDWSVELQERHRLFVDIVKLAQRLGVSFAFPTSTLHLHQEQPAAADSSGLDDPHQAGRDLAAEITGEDATDGK